MAKKTQTANRHRSKVASQRVFNYYNHGTVNVDARQNNSTSKRHEYTGCTFNGGTEHVKDIIEDNNIPVIETRLSSPETTTTKEKKGSKRSILILAGTAILMGSVLAVLLIKLKK